jgi:uncharacterized SAM-binding protein YcdF (DUF218 family)
MNFRLIERRSVLFPTLWGWLLLLLSLFSLGAAWWFGAESFLSLNDPLPADVLVFEAWTGTDGAAAAAIEFKHPGRKYRYIVAAGGLAGDRWSERRWSYVEVAERDLLRLGIPRDKIIPAQCDDVATQRTYETAIAAKRVLESRGIKPSAVNVITRGVHARRSRLTFSKVFEPETEVGVISWTPRGYYEGPWWQSSARADEMLKETVGYLFELLLNSGRRSNSKEKAQANVAHADAVNLQSRYWRLSSAVQPSTVLHFTRQS